MDAPFQFDRHVAGKYFIGRDQDCRNIGDIISEGGNVAIWAPPKSGKMSLVRQVLSKMRTGGVEFLQCDVDASCIHDPNVFLCRYAGCILESLAASPDEIPALAGRFLAGTSLVHEPAETGLVFRDLYELSTGDAEAVANLPYAMAEYRGMNTVIIVRETQNIYSEENEDVIIALEKAIAAHLGKSGFSCSFIFLGSKVNAMEHIFRKRHFFHSLAVHYPMPEPSGPEIADHVVRGFGPTGKSVERNLVLGFCRLLRNNLWYMNNLFFLCNALSRGFITDNTAREAMACMISAQEPRFFSVMDGLTGFQERLLKAVIDGNFRFSSSEVIGRYRLNSSANVKRLKEALMKKEVIMFNGRGEPVIQDPLFEYWLRKYYFK